MIRAAAVCLLLAGPAAATVDGYPALHDVVGVAEGDVLNIRSGPGADFAIIGTLPSDAEGIEVIRPSDDFDWGLINAGEGPGWISLRHAVPQPGQWDGSIPGLRICFGTEPFWSLRYDPPRITLTAPDIEPREGLISGIHGSLNHRNRFAFTGSFLPAETGDRDIHLSVRRAACSDGMSDREYGLEVDMLLTRPGGDGDTSMTGLYSGCCSIQPPAE